MTSFDPGYLEELRKRGKESRVYSSFQLDGLEIARMLRDEKHKALYIKLVKQYGAGELRVLAGRVAEMGAVKNKGAYFMTVLKEAKLPKKQP